MNRLSDSQQELAVRSNPRAQNFTVFVGEHTAPKKSQRAPRSRECAPSSRRKLLDDEALRCRQAGAGTSWWWKSCGIPSQQYDAIVLS